jgi:anhydro-N-acetylmuramic acid kinase
MTEPRVHRVIGLMSGTSLDGIDAAFVATDGMGRIEAGPSLTIPYEGAFRARIKSVLGGTGDVAGVERELTELHAAAVRALQALPGAGAADLVGFHGQTILHRPREGRTWQIGDGALLAELTGIDVVNDFRSADVAAGGEGAPLVPLYHRALAAGLARPAAVLNIGGVANVTWIGAGADDILAFDTGPGNALLDDWMQRHTGSPIDRDGDFARQGQVAAAHLERFLENPYFRRPPPKSLDRDDFADAMPHDLAPEDGAATLAAMTAHAALLRERLGVPVEPVEARGWDGDALEAQAFAYLAARSVARLPLSLPSTTGARHPVLGGRMHRAR